MKQAKVLSDMDKDEKDIILVRDTNCDTNCDFKDNKSSIAKKLRMVYT